MLRNRQFLFLWFVNIATTLAIELFTITILVTIYEQTESTLQAAGTMVARTMPAFLLGPVAGVLVDRFPRKNMLISMDLVRLVLVGIAIWFLQGDGKVPVAGIYLILAGLAAADVFHRPARLSLIPSLVTWDQLVKANSFILASNQIMVAISYTVYGWRWRWPLCLARRLPFGMWRRIRCCRAQLKGDNWGGFMRRGKCYAMWCLCLPAFSLPGSLILCPSG